MYHTYVSKCQQSGTHPVKSWAYQHVFNAKFNLSFHPPRKDTCKKCDIYKAAVTAVIDKTQKQKVRADHELHLRKAEAVRKSLSEEKQDCSINTDHESITFDLQKVHSTSLQQKATKINYKLHRICNKQTHYYVTLS